MNLTQKRIIAFCATVSAIALMVTVCFLSYRLISTAVDTRAQSRPVKEQAAPEVDLDPVAARLQELLDEIDTIRKKQRLVRTGKVSSFDELSDEEKNRIWWEIVSIAKRVSIEPPRYTLTNPQAMLISDRYGPSERKVYMLLREGVNAPWRTPDPPAPPAADRS